MKFLICRMNMIVIFLILFMIDRSQRTSEPFANYTLHTVVLYIPLKSDCYVYTCYFHKLIASFMFSFFHKWTTLKEKFY